MLNPTEDMLLHLAWDSLEAAEIGAAKQPVIPPEKLPNDALLDGIIEMGK